MKEEEDNIMNDHRQKECVLHVKWIFKWNYFTYLLLLLNGIKIVTVSEQ